MTTQELMTKLAAVERLQLDIIPFFIELHDSTAASTQLIDLDLDVIDQGRKEIEEHYYLITKAVSRCLDIRPKPSTKPPLGF